LEGFGEFMVTFLKGRSNKKEDYKLCLPYYLGTDQRMIFSD
jgi:hypothetical protein